LHELFANPDVMHGLNKQPVQKLEQTRGMIEAGIDGWRADGLGPFVLEIAATRQVVGQARPG
jgi:hypothetical protein